MADLKKLNINTDEISFPRASEHIKEQINLIKTLEERGFAYKTSDGMYFDTAKFRAYGKLGNIDLAHLREGARVTINSQKKILQILLCGNFLSHMKSDSRNGLLRGVWVFPAGI